MGTTASQRQLGSIADRVASMEPIFLRLTTIERSITGLGTDVSRIVGRFSIGPMPSLRDLDWRISDLAACVNNYMDTVARARGGTYTSYWCG